MGDTVIKVKGVSKKFCRRLRHSMMYGTLDVARGMLGMGARTDELRPNEFWAVDDISFELKRGETLGLIGPNGSGKSTLLRLLNGIYQPDKGRIEIRGRVGALIAVGAGFHPLMTGRENIYLNGTILGMTRSEIDRKFDAIVDFADIGEFLDAPVKTYSSGMYVRLGFAVAIHCDPDILLVDEVLAVGDFNFRRKCYDKIGEIRKTGASIILVTHAMHHLTAITSRAMLLVHGQEKHCGDVTSAVDMYRRLSTNIAISDDIEKVLSSTEKLTVHDVGFYPSRKLHPGDDLTISIEYEAREDIHEVECHVAILRKGDCEFYFVGSNRSVNQSLFFPRGKGNFEITLKSIPINNGAAELTIILWEKGRIRVLFWWRNILLSFGQAIDSTGENYIKVSYGTKVLPG